MSTKTCNKCGVEKPLDEFHNRKDSPDGKRNNCRQCQNLASSSRYGRNREESREYRRKHYRENRERYLGSAKARYDRIMSDDQLAKAHRRYKLNYRLENPEVYFRSSVKYVERNRAAIGKRQMDRFRRLYKRCPIFTTSIAVRNILRRCTGDVIGVPQYREYEKYLGYTADQLKARIECQFKPGMTWSNYGDWHIDHKIPVSRFLKRSETRLHIINALSNLQPLWATDNLKKGARWVG